ncbi:MAG TPA: EscU/YscU/HrcU family type III secretion system export apparatus switch protein [Bryobacteraceae bacterium]|jgi:flagellar biosynthetic protein FlhB|nr:EscU/YscU/HrcU family type III secretion system export apparatus switch protein [Bryobacteraceae bacterium]
MADQGQKSEKATPRRIQKAREEGNFPTSRVFVSSLQFLAFVALLHNWGPQWVQSTRIAFAEICRNALDPRRNVMDSVYEGVAIMERLLLPVGVLGGVMIGIALAMQLLVTGFGFSVKKLTPDFKRLNPIEKIRQLPRQNLPAALQAAIMIPVFAAAVYYAVTADLTAFLSMPVSNLRNGISQIGVSVLALLWKAGGLFLVFGLVDLVRQKSRYRKDLMMSKQEIRDEMKEMEGNPLMKSRIRRIRRDLARRRMMKEVPTATAVVVNPTHYAVALKYSLESPGAPRVVAKGKNYLALRIRQKAIENQVPLIENPPLAQGLYKSVDVGQEIPARFYKAVAEVLAYIYRVMDGRRPGGGRN